MSTNYTSEDRWLLIQLVEKNKDVIENKSLDNNSNVKKNESLGTN